MHVHVGIDVGAVGVKAALLLPGDQASTLDAGASGNAFRTLSTARRNGLAVLVSAPHRTRGRPLETTLEILQSIFGRIPVERLGGLMLTGSGADLVAPALSAATCNDFQAAARAVNLLDPRVRTVFEIGGQNSRYIRLEPEPGTGRLQIVDYGANGDCASGTGAFLDQQASRLKVAVDQIGTVAAQAERTPQIAGRCSVFAKSDMIHAQQRGYIPQEVLRGLCYAVATNFKSAVVKARTPQPPVAVLGGVSAIEVVIEALREVFELDRDSLFVPEAAESLGAVGAALIAAESHNVRTASASNQPAVAAAIRTRLTELQAGEVRTSLAFPTLPPLNLKRVTLLRDATPSYRFSGGEVDAYLGIDVGSVGTKLVLIDTDGQVIYDIFTRTDGRPIQVVSRCLGEIEQAVGWGVRIRGVGTTGSGRELIGELVGADSINDEITAHKTGATFVGDRLLGRRPDTIFEIGGQDSKYISLQAETDGSAESVVVDFAMNDACAAGTGSFLEERADELGVSIKDEFSELALCSRAPIRLGERCTVFMERDVNAYLQRGAKREDVVAGLAYSIVYNYINRVVRARPIGECVFFQGGTAHNDAVAAAFSLVTGKPIIVPPHNAVLGAIGAALLAAGKMQATRAETRFRGYDLSRVDYSLREFTCRGCGNQCSIQQFTVEGEKTFWGDKCSERYRKKVRSDRKPVIPDLSALRRRLLEEDDVADPPDATATIGIPRAMYTYDLLPLWRRFFRDCGFRVVLSSETNRQIVRHGLTSAVAEPCFPIIVAHGHVAELIQRGVDYVWLPNILSSEPVDDHPENHVCPWGQTLPFVIRQAPIFRHWAGRILCATLHFKYGEDSLRRALVRTARDLGVRTRKAERAFAAALADLQRFRNEYQRASAAALQTLQETGEPGVVLVGRPYNIHDPGVSLSLTKKLRESYGVNVLPLDCLPLSGVDIRDINDNMYWSYGKRILAAARLVGRYPNLHLIYVTNFKCGPDSFVRAFVQPASGKPFLTLQFDAHSNDAGVMTRCEAYLDSKGILRCWQSQKGDRPLPDSRAEPSICLRCLTPSPD